MTLESIGMAFLFGGMGALMINAIKGIIKYERRQFQDMNEVMHERIQRAMRETLEREQRPGGMLDGQRRIAQPRFPDRPVSPFPGVIPPPPSPPPARDQHGRLHRIQTRTEEFVLPSGEVVQVEQPQTPANPDTLRRGKRKIDFTDG